MLRPALAAVLLALPALADGGEPPRRTEPSATFAAEAVVLATRVQEAELDGMSWVELSLRVSRCHAGPCTIGQAVKVRAWVEQWRGRHGETVGVVRYAWNDARKQARTWSVALRLDVPDEHERFAREAEAALAAVGTPAARAVAAR